MDQERVLQDVLEIVQFLRDTAVSKEEATNFATKDDLKNFATKDDLAEMKNELMNHIDGFVVLHQKLDTELAALRHK